MLNAAVWIEGIITGKVNGSDDIVLIEVTLVMPAAAYNGHCRLTVLQAF